MGAYRKKPVVIEAVQFPQMFDIDARLALEEWIGSFGARDRFIYHGDKLIIKTLEGPMKARVGDWIIRGVKGEFYPCKPDIFAATYEPLDAALSKAGQTE